MTSLFFDRYFSDLLDVQNQIERFFGRGLPRSSTFSGGIAPSVNLFEKGDDIVVTAELPGVEQKSVNIELKNDVLTLSGEKKSDSPEGVSYHRRERGYGHFSRSVQLPYKVNPEKSMAEFNDGVLMITVAKAEEAKPRRIEIK